MSAPTIPPGGTIVDSFKKTFADVPIDADKDNAVGTSEFLEAAESLTMIFGTFRLPSPRPSRLSTPARGRDAVLV